MIFCKVCNKGFKMLTNSHLKLHGLTPSSYLEQFPEARLWDEEMKERFDTSRYRLDIESFPVCEHPKCTSRCNQRNNKYCSRACAMSHRMSSRFRGEQSGSKNYQFHKDGGWYAYKKEGKKKAKARDKNTCQKCGEKRAGNALHVHHIIPQACFDDPKEANQLKNLVCLCHHCHKLIEWEMIRLLYRRAMQQDQSLPPNERIHKVFKALISG